MSLLSVVVSLLVVLMAALTIVGVMVLVLREKHEHEEYYIPGQTPEMRATEEQAKVSDTH